MPFGINFGSSKSKSTFSGTDNYNKNFNQSVAPTNAPWITDTAQRLNGNLNGLADQDPYQFIAGPDALQASGGVDAAGLTGTPWAYDAATDLTRGVAQADSPRTAYVDSRKMIGSFNDPYQQQVVNATSADLDHSDNIARQQADLADPAAFGGSGIALTKPAMEDALSRARATALGGLRSQGYWNSVGAAQSEAGRKQGANDTNAALMDAGANRELAAAGQMADIAGKFGETQRQNVATKLGAGGIMQQLAQLRAQAPLDFQNYLAQLFTAQQPGLFHGEDTTGAETGTETQSGTQTGKGSSFGFKFGTGG